MKKQINKTEKSVTITLTQLRAAYQFALDYYPQDYLLEGIAHALGLQKKEKQKRGELF